MPPEIECLSSSRVFVGQLPKKLEPDSSAPRYIVTEP